VRFILTSADTDGSLALMQQRSAPGAGIPLHVHTREDEIFQVLEGQVEFVVEGRTLLAEAGTVVYAHKNLPHSFRVVGTKPALFQVLAIPGGLEKMLDEIMRLPAPPDPGKIAGVCEQYGIKFLHQSPGPA